MSGEQIGCIIMFFVGLIVFFVSNLIRKKMIGNCSVKIKALITEVRRHRAQGPGQSNVHSTSIFEYDYEGNHYTATARTFTGPRKVGVQETIIIDPDNPEKHYRHYDLSAVYFLMGWGCIIAISGIVYFISSL